MTTEKNIRALFGKNLKWIRKKRGMSQLSLSVMTGLTHNFINDIENCKKWFSPETMARFCNVLKVEPFQFFLSDSELAHNDKIVFLTYMDDFSTKLEKSVRNFQSQYLNNETEDDKS